MPGNEFVNNEKIAPQIGDLIMSLIEILPVNL